MAHQDTLFDSWRVPEHKRYEVGSYFPSGKVAKVFFVYHFKSGARVLNAARKLRKFATAGAARKAADALERAHEN